MKRFQRNASAATRLSAIPPAAPRPADPWPSAQLKAALRRRLLAWFRNHARSLPWRDTRDPYAIWLSEVMLQQTQVATVIPYYHRFLLRFPSVAALAAADEHDVLRLWEGLGYYRRARQLHAAAKRIVAHHGGEFPVKMDAVRRLSGIGRYTAGAILSFAFDSRQPILEANTLRLFARLLAFGGDPLSGGGQRLLWSAAESILPTRGSGQVNQALMELGSQVCKPREPRCGCCPVADLCPTHRAGLQEVIPRSARKPKIENVREMAVVVSDGQRVLLVERADGERWAGLWDFPRFACNGSDDVQGALAAAVARSCSLAIKPESLLTTLRHGVTRFRITLDVFSASLICETNGNAKRSRSTAKDAKKAGAASNEKRQSGSKMAATHRRPFSQQRWVRPRELVNYPLCTTGRKIAELLIGQGK